jgi:CDP-2,3-bis-(O-geranylgeranyl)-sn-glycerol synthase
MAIFELVIKSFYFMLPVYFANMAPVFLAKIPYFKELNAPMDFGKEIGKKRVLGSHKTWRGFIGAIIAAIIVVFVQKALMAYGFFSSISLVDYGSANLVLFGFLLGFGAMAGDAVKSFFKRRIDIGPGQSWPFFDQVDYIIGALLFVSIIYRPPLDVVITVFIITPILNILTNALGYFLKLKEVWW